MQDKIEKARLEELAQEEYARATHEKDLRRYRELLHSREVEFDAYRARLKEEQLQREKELQQEFEAREKQFADRERRLIERQRDFERHLQLREAETETLRTYLQNQVADREASLQQALSQLESEKQRYNEESRKKLEVTSKDYVSDALDTLDRKERQFHRISKIWSMVGAGGIIGGIGFFVYVSLSSAVAFPATITWELITFIVFKGLVAVTLLVGLAKYAFLFSNNYMQEALKNADRRHAINFGKFYLESYGAAAEWTQVKEAFEHWNIAGSSAFNQKDSSLPDISSLEKATNLIEKANAAVSKLREGKNSQ